MSCARRSFAGALVLALVWAVIPVVAASRAHAAGLDLPPAGLAQLKKRFDPLVRPMGLQVTRGMLQNLETYQADPQGTHLALYVEPIASSYPDARYVKNFTRLTRALVPLVFQRWEGLESFDICQEPIGDPREVPPPRTQIFVARSALDRVGSWKKADLADLLRASPRTRDVAAGYYVYFDPVLRSQPAFAEAAAAVGWTTGSTAFGH